MFTQSVPAPAPAPSSTGLHVASSTSPASPTSRTSRLRGLSYLRNYTQSHILNREHGGGSNSSTSTPFATSPSVADPPIADVLSSPATAAYSVSLARSESCPSHSTTPSADTTAPLPVGASIYAASPPPPPLPPSDDLAPRAIAAADGNIPATSAAADIVFTTATPAIAATTAATATTATAGMSRSRSATESNAGANTIDSLPSIRFSTFYDPRSTRPSLKFATTSRTLPTGKEVIRVGRYSERDSVPNPNPNAPSAAHVGFKSKVVSRRHCEFWFENNRWYIKDVKSSSGTFLNHIRLSQPGTESKPFPVNDGDIVQLGIDFKGGEEMIFRCVKIRIELNRGWQNKLNAFNMNTHKRLRNMTKANEGDSATQSSQDCSICLNSIAPCQSLFVAPCSHTWHYKCVRSLLDSPQYPGFICPNCRAAVDLEADVEDPPEEWEHAEMDDGHEIRTEDAEAAEYANCHVDSAVSGELEMPSQPGQSQAPAPPSPPPLVTKTPETPETPDLVGGTAIQADLMQVDSTPSPPPASRRPPSEQQVFHATSNPVPIPLSSLAAGRNTSDSSARGAARQSRTPSPNADHVASHGHDGPITPRNDAGPWVFDGSGVRADRASTDSRRGEMHSLDTAAVELARQSDK